MNYRPDTEREQRGHFHSIPCPKCGSRRTERVQACVMECRSPGCGLRFEMQAALEGIIERGTPIPTGYRPPSPQEAAR